MISKKILVKVLIFYFVCLPALKSDNFIQSWWFKEPKGWFWYNKDNITKRLTKQIQDNITTSILPQKKHYKSAREELKEFRDYVEEIKARAVLYPTYENVKKWMEVNKAILNRSQNFALATRAVLYSNPQLDFNKSYPVSKVGVELRRKNEIFKIRNTLKKLSNKLGLIVFFSQNCPYCLKQLKALQSFNFDYPYFTIFLFAKEPDGCQIIKNFNFINSNNIKCYFDSGLGSFLNIKFYPTTYLGIPSQKKYFLLGEGLLTEADIIDRLLVIGNYNKLISDKDLPLVYRKIKENILNINKLLLEYEKIKKNLQIKEVKNEK